MNPASATSSAPLASSSARQRRFEVGAFGKFLDGNHRGGHAERRGARQAAGAWPIGDHSNYAVTAVGVLGAARDGFHVAAAAGDDHGHRQHAHSSMTTPRVPRADLADDACGLAAFR